MTSYLTKHHPIGLADKNLKNITLGICGEGSGKLGLIAFLSNDLKLTLSKNHVISKKHNEKSQCKSVVVSNEEPAIKIDLEHLEKNVKRVVLGAYLQDLTESDSNVMNEISLYLKNDETGIIEAEANLKESFSTETAFILIDMYRDDDYWKLTLLNQAYHGTDDDLLRVMGVIDSDIVIN